MLGLVAPLLLVSYVAYREATVRADEQRQHVSHVEQLYKSSVEMLAIAVDAKDQVTHGHIRRVQQHTLAVARALGVTGSARSESHGGGRPAARHRETGGARLHAQQAERAHPAEFALIKSTRHGRAHSDGRRIPVPNCAARAAPSEQWDGRGYPDGLAGTEIPIGARILSVVDCFDALTSDRPYRPRLTDDAAIEILRSRRGTFYDPAISTNSSS